MLLASVLVASSVIKSPGAAPVGMPGVATNLMNDYGCLKQGEYLNDSVVNGHLAITGGRYQHVMVLSSNYTLRSREVPWPQGAQIIPEGTTIDITKGGEEQLVLTTQDNGYDKSKGRHEREGRRRRDDEDNDVCERDDDGEVGES